MIVLGFHMFAAALIALSPSLALVLLGRIVPRWQQVLEDIAALLCLLSVIFGMLFFGGALL